MLRHTIEDIGFILRDYQRRWGGALLKIIIALACAVTAVCFYTSYYGQRLEIALQYPFYAIRGVRPPPTEAVIIAIDDATYATLKAPTSFPLPRSYIAQALEELVSIAPPLLIIDSRLEPQPSLAPEADARIVASMKKIPTTLWNGREVEDPRDPTTTIAIPSDDQFRNVAKAELSMSVGGIGDTLCFIAPSRNPKASAEERLELAVILRETTPHTIAKLPSRLEYINFYGPHLTMPRVSLSDLIAPDNNAVLESLKGKILLLGYQSRNFGKGPGNSDRFFVPSSQLPMYGVEIHAMIIGNLLDGSWLSRASLLNEITTLFFAVFILTSYALRYANWRSFSIIGISTAVMLSVAYVGAAQYYFWFGGIGTFLLAAVLTLIVSGAYFIIARDRFERLAEKKLGFRVGDRD